MKDLISIIEGAYGTDRLRSKPFVACLERLYFGYIIPWYRVLRQSEDYKQAEDIVALDLALQAGRSLTEVKLRSRSYRNNPVIREAADLHSDLYKASCPKHVMNNLRNLLESDRHILAAAFVADLLRRENGKETFRWFVAVVLSLTSVAAIIVAAVLKG